METGLSNLSIESLGEMMGLFSSSMDDYLYACDLQRDYYQISPTATERFMLPDDHFSDVTNTLKGFVYPKDYDKLVDELNEISAGKKICHNMHYRWLGHDHEPIWINCRGRVLLDEDGKPHFLVGCINEIGTKQKADNVSGLLGQLSLEMEYDSFEENGGKGFILRLGIDDFRDINENMGIEYGDYILRKTAESISENIMPGQKLFRIVADEFAVADFLGGSVEDAMQLYNKIRSAVISFIEQNHYKVVYTISGGILPIDGAKISFADAMTLSEFALSEAKRSGKNSCQVFNAEKYEEYKRKKELNRILYHAVKHDFEGFEAYFQPLVNASDGRLTGAETLLRFHMSDGSMVSPGEVIPILEESGLIIPVGRWILRQALDACREWQKYLPEFKVNVNLSYVQVLKSNVLDEIKEIVAEYGVRSSSVCIELTESGFLEANPHFTSVWNGLKDYGILLALDDFGTGYSNLHCLSDLKPAYVKMDRSFMAKALSSDCSYEYRLLVHIVEMAHSLGLHVCAEGIENDEELARVRSVGPDYIQGFYFGKPCSRADFYEKFFAPENVLPLDK